MIGFLKWLSESLDEGLPFSFTPMKSVASKEPKLKPETEAKLNNAVLSLSPTIPGVPYGNLRRQPGSQYSGLSYETNLEDILKNYVDMIHDLNKDVKKKTGFQRMLFNYLSPETPKDYLDKIENKLRSIGNEGKNYITAFERIKKYHNLFLKLKNAYADKASQIKVTISKHRPEDEPFVEQKKNK